MSKAVTQKKTGGRMLYLLLAVALIAVALVVYLVVGPAPSRDNTSYTRYTAYIPYEFDMETLPALQDAIAEVAGVPVEVDVVIDVGNGNNALEIVVVPAGEIDEKAVVGMLNSDYTEMEIEELVSGVYSPAFSTRRAVTFGFVYLLALLLIYVIAAFITDGKNGLVVLLATILNTLLVAALYVLCRIPNLRTLIIAVAMVCVLTPYLCIPKLRAFADIRQRMKKPQASAAATEETVKNRLGGIDFLVVSALVCAALVVVGLLLGVRALSYFGIMIFAAYGCAVYTAYLVTPALWVSFNKK